MARPLKEGFDYFPMDVNLDKKIQALESVFKNDGFVWIIKFWQEAYQKNTGDVRLDGYHGVIHAENSRITLERQSEIIKMCLEIGLLIKTGDGLYSSNGIKKRIEFLLGERKRWRNTHKNELSTEITPEIRGESKVKESKVNTIRGVFKAHVLFLEWFKKTTGTDYIVTSFGKDRKLLQPVIKTINREEYIAALDNFFTDTYAKNGNYSFNLFIGQINRWRPKNGI